MFITNFDSINVNKVKGVDNDTKEYLTHNGFCVLSYNDGVWYFTKTKALISAIKNYNRKGGEKNG